MKLVVIVFAVLVLAAVLTRWRSLRRAVLIVLGVLAVYAVLKLTGVIEAFAPDRDGVF